MARKPDGIKHRLSEMLKAAMGRRATVEMLAKYPDILAEIGAGTPAPFIAEVLCQKIVCLALDPLRVNQWAIELIFDRTEGKAVQGAPADDGGRIIEEKLDDISTKHLNDLASQFIVSERESGITAARKAERNPAGHVSPLLDLPSNRPGRA